ncbi:MAG TPA: class I SAM-dependent methyltransferase [Candidatus Scybalocola faecavium]|nr:class I SAM-dependent methyltransferase [Candidatus Scybalocola faecavium]
MEKLKNYARENIAYWSKRAPGYSDVNQQELASDQKTVWSQVLFQQIMKHYKGKQPEELKVLDIGTGPGFFAIILTKMGFSVTAVDYTENMLKEAYRNAGDVAEDISFYKMDAMDLAFPDDTFDVIVSRNLTWNLPDPKEAYRQWTRVLKPGGLLLNFDANWYRYLYDDTAMDSHLQDRENVARTAVEDDTAGTDVAAMEAIARKAPLSAKERPMWDEKVLGSFGMSVLADTDIWKTVWTTAERVNNASTPMFLIQAVKSVVS